MRLLNDKHRAFVGTLPCCVCGDDTGTEAAHVRMADYEIAKPMTGMGIKPDDCFVVPLCGKCHRLQHKGNEKQFWRLKNKDPAKIGMALYIYSGDYQLCCRIVRT